MNSVTWGDLPLGTGGESRYIRMGNLQLWIRREGDEIWIGHLYADTTPEEAAEKPPEDLEWARWVPKEPGDSVKLLPVYPDLPIVVQSDYTLKVAPRNDINIYTRIPVWVRITFGRKDALLTELPTVRLSRTWFGTPLEGELCYWSTTKARRSLSNVEKKPYLVSCPIQITNRTDEDLNFEKFCFRVERLTMFRIGEELWADETKIKYQGEQQNSEIGMSGRLPKELDKGSLLSEPRKPHGRSLASRTFLKFFDDSFILGR